MFLSYSLIISLLLTQVAFVKFGFAQSKIEKILQGKLQNGTKLNVFVTFDSTSKTLRTLSSNRANDKPKGQQVRDALKRLSEQDHQGVLKILSNQGKKLKADYERFWISNSIYIKRADKDLVNKIAQDPKVTRIYEEHIIPAAGNKMTQQVTPYNGNGPTDNENFTWGLQKIQVPEAWEELGGIQNAGAGAVVGMMHTGVDVEHEALRDNFIGSHGWFDPWELSVDTPVDYSGLGTHETGIAVGKFGIGVSPSSKFSVCRPCFNANCPDSHMIKCAQFFMCPTLPDGTGEDCSKAPDVILLALVEFGLITSWFDPYVDAFQAAGIFVVVPMGNGLGACGSVGYPALLENVFSVGASTSNDGLLRDNAYGPTKGKRLMKPDVVAPGQQIKSAKGDPDEPYLYWEGTVPAAAHVTGLVALLKGRDKGLTFEQVRDLIRDNADKDVQQRDLSCGGFSDKVIPNPFCGWGRINAFKSVKAHSALLLQKKGK